MDHFVDSVILFLSLYTNYIIKGMAISTWNSHIFIIHYSELLNEFSQESEFKLVLIFSFLILNTGENCLVETLGLVKIQ